VFSAAPSMSSDAGHTGIEIAGANGRLSCLSLANLI
jgi:hypothetical protein